MNFELCSKCNKHYAIMNVTKVEGDKVTQQFLCAKCAKELGVKIGNLPLETLDTSDEAMEAMDEQMKGASELFPDSEIGEEFKKGLANPMEMLKNLLSRPSDDKSGLSDDDAFDSQSAKQAPNGAKASPKKEQIKYKYLDTYCTNLTAKAAKGKLDKIIGRDKEIFRVMQILCRRIKNNPCLIGEPGVGKTAIAEGIALKIAAHDVPAALKNKQVFLLDLTGLVAGTQFRGQFESRVKGLIEEVKHLGNVILFIDEVHNLVGTGDSEGTMSAANMMKPALSRGDIQVIGATTLKEYRTYIEKDSALGRRFQPVTVEEPSVEESCEMLRGIKHYYEEFHNIHIPAFIVDEAVKLSERYVTDRFLPDKAIDMLDEACSNAVLNNPVYDKLSTLTDSVNKLNKDIEELEAKEDLQPEDYQRLAELKSELARAQSEKEDVENIVKGINVTKADLITVVELWTGIPASKINEGEGEKLRKLKENLSSRIIGQPKAIDAVVSAVKRGRISILPRKRPVSFIFAGPTGVGKTELVKVLSRELFDSPETLIRLDMSEFMEKHAVSRIIGSPPGYVGYDEAGQLTEKIRRKPYSVILFDEIEKAHPDVLNILLQILDDGVITDARGVKVSFEHTLIVMTTNAGSEIKGSEVGFNKTDVQLSENKTMTSLKQFLRPEFLNRIDEIVVFNPLPKELFPDIVKIHLEDFKNGLTEKEISFEYTPEVLSLLSDMSYSREYGARNVRRIIQTELEDRIISEICERDLVLSSVSAEAVDGKISLTFE